MKKIKKIIGISMCMLLFVGIMPTNVQAKEKITDKQKEQAKEYMLSIGIDKNVVKNAPESEIEKYVNAKLAGEEEEYYRVTYKNNSKLKTINSKQETTSDAVKINSKDDNFTIEKFEPISEEQYNQETKQNSNQNSNISLMSTSSSTVGSNTTNKSWIKLKLTATKTSTGNYTLTSSATWNDAPYFRKKDILAISNDSHFTKQQNTSYFYNQAYCKRLVGGSYWDTDDSYSPDDDDISGSAFIWNLPLDSTSTTTPTVYNQFSCYMSYKVKTNYSGSVSVSSKYAHQQITLIGSPSVSFPGGASITIGSASKYDVAPVQMSFNV